MVEDLPMPLGVADLAPAHALRADRMRPLDPVADINVMAVLLDNVIAGKPGEIIPVANLVMHFGFARHTLDAVPRASIPITRNIWMSPTAPSWMRLTSQGSCAHAGAGNQLPL